MGNHVTPDFTDSFCHNRKYLTFNTVVSTMDYKQMSRSCCTLTLSQFQEGDLNYDNRARHYFFSSRVYIYRQMALIIC